MEVAVIALCATFGLYIVIIVAARISKTQQEKAERKKTAEELARIRANTALLRLKISGLQRRTRWLEEDSVLRKEKESKLK